MYVDAIAAARKRFARNRFDRYHSLRNRVAVVTGGARGIGAEVTRQLAGAGARVAVLDRDQMAAARLAGEFGDQVAAFEADVRSAESMTAAFAAIAERFGGVDVVIANAGIAGPGATVAAVAADDWQQVIDINLLGAFNTVRAALPQLRQSGGYVMAVASIAAVMPGPTVSAYMASKAGVESLVRSLRIELAGTGVGVGIAYFGLVDTGLAHDLLSGSGFGAIVAALPGIGQPIGVAVAARTITLGVVRRARRVYAPQWVWLILDLRPLVILADRLVAVAPRVRSVIREADVERLSA